MRVNLSIGTLMAGLVLFGMLQLAVSQIEAPPVAADVGWSAKAGLTEMRMLLGDGEPHPPGSAAHSGVRDRIVAALQMAGYVPELQSALQCVPKHGCGFVQNIIAVLPGESADALLVTAHYDSVPAGPGAADDMSGVAVVLGLARDFKSKGQAKNTVIFLIADGEETGLYGAHAFAARDARFANVKTVVNAEARGSAGPSMMFETGEGNRALIELLAKSVKRPTTNSLIYEVYKVLPNDTDFTVYRKRGRKGFNFAFVGHASRYHSPTDTVDALNPNSLQHHGDNVFAVASALAAADLAAFQGEENASYFDIAGRTLVHWNSKWDLPFSLLALLGVAVCAWTSVKEKRWPSKWTMVALVSTPLMLFAAGWVLAFPLGKLSNAAAIDHATPWPGRLALVAAMLVVAQLSATFFGRRAGWQALLLSTWVLLALLGVGLAWRMPGAAFNLVFPTLGFALLALACGRLRYGLAIAGAGGFAAMAFFWINLFLSLEAAAGFAESGLRLLGLAPIAWALSGVLASTIDEDSKAIRPVLLVGAAVGVAAVAAALVPAFSPLQPRGLNMVYTQESDGTAYWTVDCDDPVPAALLKAMGFSNREQEHLVQGVFSSKDYLLAAPVIPSLPSASLTPTEFVTAGGQTTARLLLSAGGAGEMVRIAVPANSAVTSLSVEGTELLDSKRLSDGAPRSVSFSAIAGRSLRVEVQYSASKIVELRVSEVHRMSLLPAVAAAAAPLTAARLPDTAQVHRGDRVSVVTAVRLSPVSPSAAPPGGAGRN
jgi:Peptidase family M28